MSVFANRHRLPWGCTCNSLSPLACFSPPLLGAFSPRGPFRNIFFLKGNYMSCFFLLIRSVNVYWKKNQNLFMNWMVYLKRRSFLIHIVVCINSICYYCDKSLVYKGMVNSYAILFTVFSRHNCLIVTESWCKEMWQYSGMCFLNVSNYNLWALLTPTGENKITCAKVGCGVCNFQEYSSVRA